MAKKEKDWFAEMDKSILSWMWHPSAQRTGAARWGVGLLKVMYLSARNSYLDRLPFQANALTFITLLGLVPALAISFSLAKGLGFADNLKGLLINEYTASQSKVLMYIIDYVENTKVGTLGVIGLVMLVVTLVLTLSSVEGVFNRIWEAPHNRNWFRKFSDYLSVLVICPLLVLASTALWAGFSSNTVVMWLLQNDYLGPLASFALNLGPLLLLVGAFVFVYQFLPNTRVPFFSSLLAGAVAAALWWGVQSLYIHFQVGVSRYNAIYGGFASLPLFMVWVQVSWTVLLFGAELAHAHHLCLHGPLPKAVSPPLNPAQREALALGIMQKVAQRFATGGDPWSVGDLARVLRVAQVEVWSVVRRLEDAGLVAELSQEGHVMPGRNLDNVLVCEVMTAVRGRVDEGRMVDQEQEDPALIKLVTKVQAAEEEALGKTRLLDLVESADPAPPAACTAPLDHPETN